MCQLLGMNCNTPTDIQFSFEGFAKRGGLTDEHADGWGVAFFEDRSARLFIDHRPAAESPVADFIRQYPIRSLNVIAHIRKATQGVVSLRNCHPFARELWGQTWVMAHNGNLKHFRANLSGRFLPIGETDSEQAFCMLLDHLATTFGDLREQQAPTPAAIQNALEPIIQQIASHGPFNMLLSNGEALFSHCSDNLYYVIRQHPFTKARLIDCDVSIDFSQVTTPQDRVAVVATKPLTHDEQWIRYQAGEFRYFVRGEAST